MPFPAVVYGNGAICGRERKLSKCRQNFIGPHKTIHKQKQTLYLPNLGKHKVYSFIFRLSQFALFAGTENVLLCLVTIQSADSLMAAWAAASRAIGTRKGEQLT